MATLFHREEDTLGTNEAPASVDTYRNELIAAAAMTDPSSLMAKD
jgi:hypothetical protein